MTIMEDAETFWAESSKDYSHWRGFGRWRDDRVWLAIGKLHYVMIDLMLSHHSPWQDYSSLSVIDFGCGGGANVVELCQHFGCVYGMDIAAPSLVECTRQVKAMGVHNFIPMMMMIDRPGCYFRKMQEQVQIFLSTSVYQHFPSKEYGIQVTKWASQILTRHGFALIQIRYDNGNPTFKPKNQNYFANVITFTSYPSEEFATICQDCGFEILFTSKAARNYEYFFLQKK